MGKVNKRQAVKHSNHHDNPNRPRQAVVRHQHSQSVSKNANAKMIGHPGQAKSKPNADRTDHQQTVKLKVPFSKWDRILLVGEGDFSFALSLAQNHPVGTIMATCFDSKEVLEQKYPAVDKTISKLLPSDVTNDEISGQGEVGSIEPGDAEGVWNGFLPSEDSDDEREPGNQDIGRPQMSAKINIMFEIDATKLSTSHKKIVRPHGPFTKIVFNFPHVGGLSTDVNRQVRSNQQLLVNFFNAAKSLLATKSNPAKPVSASEDDEDIDHDSDTEDQQREYLSHGQILVTLFESEPYTLWNIRDLARHSGLKVLESFKFPWAAYPGYQHARTVGDIITGRDRAGEGKRKGAWRGEERDARCYLLALKDDDDGHPAPGSRKRRREQDENDSD